MKARTYLMLFDQMMELLESDNGSQACDLKDINSHMARLGVINRCCSWAADPVQEKLGGTWWEVELNARKIPCRCLYIADSLMDALRRRPDIDTTYWSGRGEAMEAYLAETEDWSEEEYYVY